MENRFPYHLQKKDLENILFSNNLDSKTGIDECKKYMALNGYTLKKRLKIENKDKVVIVGSSIRKISNFSGFEIAIAKDDIIYSAIMKEERDAFLLCVLMAIQNSSKSRM